ncbi:MAG: DUF4097 family beta strand repeat-containing protein [Fimbriimonadaceae bacterium]
MKEEIARIMRLVQEGKLTPEDGAELIAAFSEGGERTESATGTSADSATEPPKPPDAPRPPREHKDPFSSLVDLVEGLGKDVSTSVNWKEVAGQVRESAKKAVEAVKSTVEEIRAKGGLFGTHSERTIELPLQVPEGKTVVVETRSGNVRVLGGADEGRVTAKVRVGGTDSAEAAERAKALDLVIEESETCVLVKAPEEPGAAVEFELQLATRAPVEVRTISGDVRVVGTGAGCRASTTSGDLRVRGLEGRVELRTTNGDILVEECRSCDLDLESKSGDVLVRTSSGSLNARVASGDVNVAQFDGRTVSLEAVTGDVSVDFESPVSGTVNIRTVNGDVRVSLPGGSDCRVALSTLRGDVVSEIDLLEQTKEGQRLTGRLGDGTGSVDVSAVNGDIVLRQRFAPPAEG